MTSHPTHALILSALRDITPERLQKAVLGLCDGSLTVTVTRQVGDKIHGLVKNGEAKEYGVTLAEACSCPDALYRGLVCKHAVALALSVLRQPEKASVDNGTSTQEEPARTPDNSHFIHIHHDTKAETTEGRQIAHPARAIHLMWRNGSILCGAESPQRIWCWPWPDSISLTTQHPDVCQACVAERNHPSQSIMAAVA
jgi:hypothetical protein